MKKLNEMLGAVLLLTSGSAMASVNSIEHATSLGSHNDLFEGVTIDATSPILDGFHAAAAFGAEVSDPSCGECAIGGRVIFADDTMPFINFHTATPVTLGGFDVYASSDGPAGNDYRGFSMVRLLASTDAGQTFTELLGEDTYDPASGFVRVNAVFAAVTAQYFRFEASALNGGGRLVELDGLPAVPEPASWAMMLTGFALAGAALRRRDSATLSPSG